MFLLKIIIASLFLSFMNVGEIKDSNGSPNSHLSNDARPPAFKRAASPSYDASLCFRCNKKLGKKTATLLDRKYHDPVCYAVMLTRYKELREPMKLDEMSVDAANDLLATLQYHDPAAHSIGVVGRPKSVDVIKDGDDTPRYNDLANAERFLSFAGDDLLYCAEAKRWLIWQKTHWQFDREDFVFELAAEFARSLYTSEPPTKDVMKNADRANNGAGFNAMMNFAARKKTVPIDSFDVSPYEINCKNGTLDLRTGNLRPHSREDRITRIVDCDFDADATSEVFDGFMRDIQPDDAVRAFVQRSIGYSLLGVVRERSFWILYGTGNNGKSVFVNLFNNLLGEYASATTTQSVMQKDRSSIPNDIARLKGKRFIIIPETEENERLNSALVKALSAGDKMTARFLFGEFFDFYFSGKLWIATNHKPTITDHSKGFWDRLKLIPFTTDIPADKVRKSDDLMSDLMRDGSAVLAWAVQGCRDYFEIDGLDVPPVIQAEIDAYRHEQDSIAQFLEAKCQTIADARLLREANPNVYFTESEFEITNSDLYAAYSKFCKENGEFLRSHRRFTQNLRERGFIQVRGASRNWEGLRLKDT